jgi:hypothetical protein
MDELAWRVLISTVLEGLCTPFLGAGVNYGLLPLGGDVAKAWAVEFAYPLTPANDLPSVAQFVATKTRDGIFPRAEFLRLLAAHPRIEFSESDDRLLCLRALAALDLPIYLTTNYDNLLGEALRYQGKAEYRREICRWNKNITAYPSPLKNPADPAYRPNPRQPLIYHLHGSDQYVHSLVLTEDNYLDFLVNISRNPKILPPRIQEALTTSSLLFIGYSLRDINFRVIHRGLVEAMDKSQRRISVTVQLTPPDGHVGDPGKAVDFLRDYFGDLKLNVYWGTASQFAMELVRRMGLQPRAPFPEGGNG